MIYLLICFYGYKHGHTNAFLYSRKGADALTRNEHIDLTVERFTFGGALIVASLYGAMGFAFFAIAEVITGAMAFSYWHNGAYYVMRLKIDRGGKRLGHVAAIAAWKDQSETTTAWWDFSYRERSILLIASVFLLVAVFFADLEWNT